MVKKKELIYKKSILEVYSLDEMEDLITKTKLKKILRKNQCKIALLNKDAINILLKGTEKEVDVLSYLVDLEGHIDEFIFDCLIKLKSLSTQANLSDSSHNSGFKKSAIPLK